MYPTFRQTFVYILYTKFSCHLLTLYIKCIQKLVQMWYTFCIHSVYILYTLVIYILYNFCIQNVYTVSVWPEGQNTLKWCMLQIFEKCNFQCKLRSSEPLS